MIFSLTPLSSWHPGQSPRWPIAFAGPASRNQTCIVNRKMSKNCTIGNQVSKQDSQISGSQGRAGRATALILAFCKKLFYNLIRYHIKFKFEYFYCAKAEL
jgi:hypothetical protein